jgi:hypothetical protein
VHASFDLPANGRAYYGGGWDCPAWETEIGKGIDFDLSVSTGVRGHLTYIER